MRLKRLPARYMLDLDLPMTLEVEQIGRGMFCTAYRDVRSLETVYLLVDEEKDLSKEILKSCAGPYFPQLLELGQIGDRTLYRTAYYSKLRASSKVAWREYRAAAKAREAAYSETLRKMPHNQAMSNYGGVVMARTIEILQEQEPQLEALADALDTLADRASNYGTGYVFEFAPRNLAVSDGGELILLDPVFNMEETERQRVAARKRHQQRSRW